MEGYKRFQSEFHQICKEQKEKVAITYYTKKGKVEECSYLEMEKRVVAISTHYKEMGIRRGDRVAVLIPLCTNAYLDILALAYMGATSVILDVNLHEKELMRILEDVDVSCIITVQNLYEEKLQKVNTPVLNNEDKGVWLRRKEIIHAKDPDYEAIAILYSSGTTSQAKGVVIGYEQELNAMDRLLETVGTRDIRYLLIFPNSHVSGFTDFMTLLLRGGSFATMEEASSTQIVKGFRMYRPNAFGMVPKVWESFKNKIEENIRKKGRMKSNIIFFMLRFCGGLRKLTGINLGRVLFQSVNEQVFGGNLKQAHFGGGKANPEVSRFFWNMGIDVFDFYASTEANNPIAVTDGRKYMSSVGNVEASPDTEIRIWNPDDSGSGEIQVKSNMMMRGYFRCPELTEQAFEGEFFKTGDYGKIVNGELYITGRIKESIYLKNGEKVSPEDVEFAYHELLQQDIEFAVVGVEDEENYEQVCVFVVGEKGQYDDEFKKVNHQVLFSYRYKNLVYIDSLPKTSVGKVKRYQLKKMFIEEVKNEKKLKQKSKFIKGDTKEWLIDILSKYTEVSEILSEHMLSGDLSIDSLSLFELCVEVDTAFGISVEEYLSKDVSVGEILEIINGEGEIRKQNEQFDYSKYPVERTRKDWKRYDKFCKWTRKNYELRVSGIKNIEIGENYIFAPNHESHFDSMWIMSCLPEQIKENICSMAADYLFEKGIYKWGTRIMGAIPVHRSGNTSTAMKRIYELLRNDQKSLMIHPEGTRTRTGELGEFKIGAAELAIKTGVKIIPVGIRGAREIYPPDLKLPRTGKDSNGNKLLLNISFGEPIDPADCGDALELTKIIREQVVKLTAEG